MVDFIGFLTDLATRDPLGGLFLASLLGSVVPFFPVPYLLVLIFVASTNNGIGLISLATVAALGAAIGKFTSYGLGYGAGRAFHATEARFHSLKKALGGSIFLAALVFAASPLPDDVVFVPLGVMRYSPLKTFISLFSGKFVLAVLVAYTARTSFGTLAVATGQNLYFTVASIAVVILLSLLVMRINWEALLREGTMNAFKRLLRRLTGRVGGSGKPAQDQDAKSA